MKIKPILLCSLLTLLPSVALADEAFKHCEPFADKVKLITAMGGSATKATESQFRFLQGVFAVMHAAANNGSAILPLGDRAVLFTLPESKKGQIFFVDGENTCVSIQAQPILMGLLAQVKADDTSSVPSISAP